MQTVEQALVEFHTTYHLDCRHIPISEEPIEVMGYGTHHFDPLMKLRRNLIEEEYDEMYEGLADLAKAKTLAEKRAAIVKIADGAADLVYVVVGTCVSFGIPFDKCFREVQRSNMSKLGEDGKPIIREEDGKILKGPNFTPPDLERVIYGRDGRN